MVSVDSSDEKLATLADNVGQTLQQRQLRVTTAESCTGGWIAKLFTDIAGSSTWFERGFVTYSNESKQDMLGVTSSVLHSYGAVSEETVIEMAKGALTHSQADVSVAISGIAGPGGGTPQKPIGLVWFAWAGTKAGKSMRTVVSRQQYFDGDRDAVRRQAVAYALMGILEQLGDN